MTDLQTPVRRCGCPEFTLSRRRFLTGVAAGAGAMAGATMFGDAFRQVAYADNAGGNVLVVLSLRGGSDGLSIVAPKGATDDTLLRQLRPDLYVPRDRLVGGNADWGLHPALAPLLPMWQVGTFGAVHGVGLPAPNRSHFEAMELVEDADPGSSARVGWINRLVGLVPDSLPEEQIQFGTNLVPTASVGPASALAVYGVDDLRLADHWLDEDAPGSVTRMWSGNGTPLARGVATAVSSTGRLHGLATTPVDDSAYPEGELQSVLSNTAALIKANVGARIVTIDYGDWDMHTGVGRPEPGDGNWLHNHLDHLARSLVTFFADLGPEWSGKVTLVTISEFGRRVEQNGSGAEAGLDHGYGNAMLAFGAGVNGGDVRGGNWQGLDNLNDGDVALSHDYRDVLWEIVAARYPEMSGQRAAVFPGMGGFSPTGIMS